MSEPGTTGTENAGTENAGTENAVEKSARAVAFTIALRRQPLCASNVVIGGPTEYCLMGEAPSEVGEIALSFFKFQLDIALALSPVVVEVWFVSERDILASLPENGVVPTPGRRPDVRKTIFDTHRRRDLVRESVLAGDRPPPDTLDFTETYLITTPKNACVGKIIRISCTNCPWLYTLATGTIVE